MIEIRGTTHHVRFMVCFAWMPGVHEGVLRGQVVAEVGANYTADQLETMLRDLGQTLPVRPRWRAPSAGLGGQAHPCWVCVRCMHAAHQQPLLARAKAWVAGQLIGVWVAVQAYMRPTATLCNIHTPLGTAGRAVPPGVPLLPSAAASAGRARGLRVRHGPAHARARHP